MKKFKFEIHMGYCTPCAATCAELQVLISSYAIHRNVEHSMQQDVQVSINIYIYIVAELEP